MKMNIKWNWGTLYDFSPFWNLCKQW